MEQQNEYLEAAMRLTRAIEDALKLPPDALKKVYYEQLDLVQKERAEGECDKSKS